MGAVECRKGREFNKLDEELQTQTVLQSRVAAGASLFWFFVPLSACICAHIKYIKFSFRKSLSTVFVDFLQIVSYTNIIKSPHFRYLTWPLIALNFTVYIILYFTSSFIFFVRNVELLSDPAVCSLFFRTLSEAVLMLLSHLWAKCRTCTCGHMSWPPVRSTAWPPVAATSEEMSSLGPRRRWSFMEASPHSPLTPVTKKP